MPETAVEFVHGVGLAMETIDGERGARHVVLASIAHRLNVMALTGMKMIWVRAGHHVMSFQVFVGEFIQGLLTKLTNAPG